MRVRRLTVPFLQCLVATPLSRGTLPAVMQFEFISKHILLYVAPVNSRVSVGEGDKSGSAQVKACVIHL